MIGHCGGEVKGRFAVPLFERVTITNAPGPMAGYVAELAVAVLLYGARNVDGHRAALRRPSNAVYARIHRDGVGDETVVGRAIGVLGFGRIGRAITAMLRPFGARVLVHDPYVTAAAVRRPSSRLPRRSPRRSSTKDDGFTYLCTGTLLNDSLASNTPYFLSASHCLDSATAARTLNTFWFFDAVECGSTAVPPYVQQASGATMLARSADWDWGLVRLGADPRPGRALPPGVLNPFRHSARCRCSIIPRVISKKWSYGNVERIQALYRRLQFRAGPVQPGDDRTGFQRRRAAQTFLASGGYYEVRGGLCAAPRHATTRRASTNTRVSTTCCR